MTFFPFLRNDIFSSQLDLHCFSPNSSQPFLSSNLHLYLAWSDGHFWQIRFLYEINNNESIRISDSLVDVFDIPEGRLVLLFFSECTLPNTLQSLSNVSFDFRSLPVWRATISLNINSHISTSYQGEINCFRPKSSFLSFSYLYQPQLSNYMFFLNLESSPSVIEHELLLSNCITPGINSVVSVFTNCLNVIPLDNYIIDDNLYSFSSQTLSGIPLFIASDDNKTFLSMEHTHPPASNFLHGNRWSLQSTLKKNWFKRIYRESL